MAYPKSPQNRTTTCQLITHIYDFEGGVVPERTNDVDCLLFVVLSFPPNLYCDICKTALRDMIEQTKDS